MILAALAQGSSMLRLAAAWQRYRDIGRPSEAVSKGAGPACIEQVVTGKEAFRAWRFGWFVSSVNQDRRAAKPGSAAYGMYLPPEPKSGPRYRAGDFGAAGVEQRRSRPSFEPRTRATALERTYWAGTSKPIEALAESSRRRGVDVSGGQAARARRIRDAWSIGDYHVGRDIELDLDRRRAL